MSNTTSTATAEFVKVLRTTVRKGDYRVNLSLVVESYRMPGVAASFTTLIREEKNDHAEYGRLQARYTVQGTHAFQVHDYRSTAWRIATSEQIFYSEMSGPIRSLSNVLKVGDSLQVRWDLGNNTDKLWAAGFKHDRAFIQVIRDGKFVAEFLVRDMVTPYENGDSFEDRYVGEDNIIASYEALRAQEEVAV